MNAQARAQAQQSPLIDAMMAYTFRMYLTAFGMLVMAAVGLWMIENPDEVDN